MNALSHARSTRLNRQPRGFSLIELGIVIAVIAVLASVVIFGRGFIASSRSSKMIDAVASIRAAGSTMAGLQGGTVKTSSANEMAGLVSRNLVPANPWTVTTGFQVTDVRLQHISNENVIAIKIVTPSASQTADLWQQAKIDANYWNTASDVGSMGTNCAASTEPAAATDVICYKL